MSNEKKQSFMGGVTVLAISTVFVKLCGALYKIPLNNILGDEGIAHFMSAYNIYSFLLTLSTAGLPLALSKLISEANATGHTNQVRRCFRTALALFVVLGIVGTAAMLLFTRELAAWMNNSMAYWPIKALGVSVICVSIMCAYRGYAQGQQNMVPTAVSQFLEAFFKLVVGLPLAWYFINRGMGFGDNSQAMLVTRGVAEITRIGLAMGAKRRTFMGLTGIGDLIVTCTSHHSRNNRCGKLIGEGKSYEEASREIGMVVEGYYALEAAMQLSEKYGVEMPITSAVYDVIKNGCSVHDAMLSLMNRNIKSELES